jgi:K+/H+ antiporter YhaU regulatory subunit KhtT
MWKKILAMVCILCLLFLMNGCQSSIESDDEAAAEMANVTEEISGITSDLQDINQNLGSETT